MTEQIHAIECLGRLRCRLFLNCFNVIVFGADEPTRTQVTN